MFKVIPAEPVRQWLILNKDKVMENVLESYCLFHEGKVVNPDSYFLRFPDSDKNRIIALPASLEGDEKKISGIKWISSFPENTRAGLNRASAVVILNDRKTGYPIGCIEGSQISSARTAASAVLGASYLHPEKVIKQLAIIGTGLISFSIIEFFLNTGWRIGKITVSDISEENANNFIHACIARINDNLNFEYKAVTEAISGSDLIVIATSAVKPHVVNPELFSHHPTVLHISLRDLSPEIILNAANYVDDVSHACKASTSLHLAEQQVGNRSFISGNIAELALGKVTPDMSKPRVFSPFGMGMLDIALANLIFENVSKEKAFLIPEFNAKSILTG